jgi:RecB family exonuclease
LPDLKKLFKIYEESWIDDWYKDNFDKESYRKKGYDILKEFHQLVIADTPAVMFLEKGFSFKINDYVIKGTMDRIDLLPDKTLEIIDYKTGSAKDLGSIEKDQLLIYQLAARQIFKESVGKLTFYYLNENSPVSFLGTEKELKKQEEKIIKLITAIQQKKFNPMPDAHTCKYCDFNNICEHRVIS